MEIHPNAPGPPPYKRPRRTGPWSGSVGQARRTGSSPSELRSRRSADLGESFAGVVCADDRARRQRLGHISSCNKVRDAYFIKNSPPLFSVEQVAHQWQGDDSTSRLHIGRKPAGGGDKPWKPRHERKQRNIDHPVFQLFEPGPIEPRVTQEVAWLFKEHRRYDVCAGGD